MQEYAVLNLIGKGGFACVYRAQCKSTGLQVAIKMVRGAYCGSSEVECLPVVNSASSVKLAWVDCYCAVLCDTELCTSRVRLLPD